MAASGDKSSEQEPENRAARHGCCLPRWVALVFFAVCLGLIPQIIHLSSSLAEVELANNWRTVWVVVDIAEAVVFLLTAWFLFRRSVFVTITASMAAAMIWLDAWFDVMTAVHQPDVDDAIMLVYIEVPLGAFCLYIALRPLLGWKLGWPWFRRHRRPSG